MLKRDTADFLESGNTAPQGPSSDHLSDPLQADTGAVSEGLQSVAQHAFGGTPSPLPHKDTIQESFGQHKLTSLKAYQDKPAQEANEALGSQGLAQRDSVALKTTDLHTAAHEAAHVIQQRAGVHPKADAGRSSDPLERHADAVADKVVAGESAEGLLSEVSGGNSGSLLQPKLNYDWRWAEGLTRSWKEGAGELWAAIQGPFDETFLPRWEAVREMEVPEGELKEEWENLAVFARYDGQQITMEQGRAIKSELLPLLDKSSLAVRVQSFKAKFQQDADELVEYASGLNISKGKLYVEVRSRMLDLRRESIKQSETPDYKTDLARLRLDLEAVMVEKQQIQTREQERQELDKKERARIKQEEADLQAEQDLQAERLATLEKKVRDWRGRVHLAMLKSIGGNTELEPFVDVVSKGDVGRLASLGHLDGSNSELLELVKAHSVQSPLKLMDHEDANAKNLLSYLSAVGSQSGARELLDLCVKVSGATALLGKVSVSAARRLMELGGEGQEAHVLSLLDLKGDDVSAVAAVLDTESGRSRAEDVKTALTGANKLSDERAPVLLATKGMRGVPVSTKKLMKNDKVLAHRSPENEGLEDPGLKTAEMLLNEKANAKDVLFILEKVGVEDALKLAKTKHIKGTGEEVKWILDQSVSVENTEKLLKYKSGVWGKDTLTAHGHAPQNIVHINKALRNGKDVWTGSSCGTPTFLDKSGNAVTEADVIKNVGGLDESGGTYHSQGFINSPDIHLDDMLLPKHGENYQEYDIKPYVSEERGMKRVVIGSRKFYTADHYASFSKYA